MPHTKAKKNSFTQSNVDSSLSHPQELVRINKAIANTGLCSRRKAEEFILAGKVYVNGARVSDLGHKVSAEDTLEVDGKLITQPSSHVYLKFHKPIQTLCTAHDPEGRTTIFDILPKHWQSRRLFTVGRLDYFSEGLLLLTDDGHFAQKLAHPSFHLPKIYHVIVREAVSNEHLKIMRKGMTLAEGEKLAPVEVHILDSHDRSTLLELTLHQGINRQIRRMCRDLELTILKLTRIAQGPVELGNLGLGKVREMSTHELDLLHKALKLS